MRAFHSLKPYKKQIKNGSWDYGISSSSSDNSSESENEDEILSFQPKRNRRPSNALTNGASHVEVLRQRMTQLYQQYHLLQNHREIGEEEDDSSSDSVCSQCELELKEIEVEETAIHPKRGHKPLLRRSIHHGHHQTRRIKREPRKLPEINILPANHTIARENSYLNRYSYYPYDSNFKLLSPDEAKESFYSHSTTPPEWSLSIKSRLRATEPKSSRDAARPLEEPKKLRKIEDPPKIVRPSVEESGAVKVQRGGRQKRNIQK